MTFICFTNSSIKRKKNPLNQRMALTILVTMMIMQMDKMHQKKILKMMLLMKMHLMNVMTMQMDKIRQKKILKVTLLMKINLVNVVAM